MTMTTTRPAETGAARDLLALPKGHLHLHMEAAMRPATLAELAGRMNLPVPDTTTFTGFTEFSTVYRTLLTVMSVPEHLELVIQQIFEDQAAQGVTYVELGVSSTFYTTIYGSDAAALEAMAGFARAAAERSGVAFGLMATIDRTAGYDRSLTVAEAAAQMAGRGVVSLGLAADERGFPCADFADAFAIARDAGLHATPHAGELVGPESVWEAIDILGASRVQHGVRAIEDPALVAALAERGTPLDVCPTSNDLLDVVEEIGSHPLPLLLEAGVRCSINADDPIIFGPDILAEYELCRTALGLSDEQLAACAWTSIETTSAPDDVKAAAKARIDAWLA